MKASKSVRFLCQATFALSSFIAAGIPAHGQGVPGYPDDIRYGFDPREIALLPRYCIYTQLFRDNVPGGNNPDEIKRWTLAMGPAFNHMHHYCWGLMNTNRALLLVRDQRWRTYHLKYSIAEFDYVIDRAPADFKMLPEILNRKGENLIRLDMGPQGVRELERAIAVKPDYWPSYAALSDYYRKLGVPAKARKWLERGLSVTPDVKALERRMAELNAAKEEHTTAPQSATPQLSIKP